MPGFTAAARMTYSGSIRAVGGERGIRTLGTGFNPYNGLANRRFRPLSHLSPALRASQSSRRPKCWQSQQSQFFKPRVQLPAHPGIRRRVPKLCLAQMRRRPVGSLRAFGDALAEKDTGQVAYAGLRVTALLRN